MFRPEVTFSNIPSITTHKQDPLSSREHLYLRACLLELVDV